MWVARSFLKAAIQSKSALDPLTMPSLSVDPARAHRISCVETQNSNLLCQHPDSKAEIQPGTERTGEQHWMHPCTLL